MFLPLKTRTVKHFFPHSISGSSCPYWVCLNRKNVMALDIKYQMGNQNVIKTTKV
jgi:hypothetical protein